MYAVTIEPLNSVFFLTDDPGEGPWAVEGGAQLDIPSNYDLRPKGAPPPEQVVCVSTSDPKHFKIFKYSRDINPSEFRPTGKSFGGLLSKRTWQSFRDSLSKHLAFLNIPDDDPPVTLEPPLRAIQSSGE
jgi:hypothetical protein